MNLLTIEQNPFKLPANRTFKVNLQAPASKFAKK